MFEFLDQFIHSNFDDVVPCVLPSTKVLSLRLESHIPKYLPFNIPGREASNQCHESRTDHPDTSEHYRCVKISSEDIFTQQQRSNTHRESTELQYFVFYL